MKRFYITTTLPYVNAEPHIGFAMEIVQADILARYHKLMGEEVFFNTGTDEHGQKIYEKALVNGEDPQIYSDRYAEKFKELQSLLRLSPNLHFIRTTDANHTSAAQEFWKRCDKNGDIYKKQYKVKYCVGCELEKTDSELDENGRCLLHPNAEIQIIDEENYFFRFSKYQEPLLKFYREHPDFVVPDFRFNEIIKFVERGLEDFSISRLKSKMSWGIPVAGDDSQVMYVWFDALINYISTLGWPMNESDKEGNYALFWPGMQVAGKDNLRQQSAMWQAMLMSAGLPNSRQIFIHGFFNSGGQKMSKSLGNVIDPVKIVEEYGIDALRYYLAREANPYEDSDFTMERFKEAYNANLANGLGNLVSRIMKMATTYEVSINFEETNNVFQTESVISKKLNEFRFDVAMDYIWQLIQSADEYIQKEAPFKKIKVDPDGAKKDVRVLLEQLQNISNLLEPFLPDTSESIKNCLTNNAMPEKPLFMRKD